MKHVFSLILSTFLSFGIAFCQEPVLDSTVQNLQKVRLLNSPEISQIDIEGRKYYTMLSDSGDTLYVADLGNINVSAPRTFDSRADYLRYMKYRRYAVKVYPYAKEAIRIFREAQIVSETMKKRKRKRYLKKLSKELSREFEEPLTKLSKTQGKIMVKMIERELETPMFDLIKQTQGRLKAFYWNQSSKLYGYRLKGGYQQGHNPILDIVLQDFDVSY